MSERSIIETRIKRKESEIQSLEKKLEAGRIYLQALRDILRAIDKDTGDDGAYGTPLRKGSSVTQARERILQLGVPVHIDDLLRLLGKERTRQNKASLTGSLAAYVRREEIFTRPAPNTYGLIELQHFEADETPDEPPRDFGDVTSSSSPDEEIPF